MTDVIARSMIQLTDGVFVAEQAGWVALCPPVMTGCVALGWLREMSSNITRRFSHIAATSEAVEAFNDLPDSFDEDWHEASRLNRDPAVPYHLEESIAGVPSISLEGIDTD